MTIGAPLFYPTSPVGIRDGTAARVATVAGLANVYKARTMPGQDAQLPYAIVWNAGERTQPNGDANTGQPAFLHTLTLVVDVMMSAGDEPTLDADIVSIVETIRATLMTDPTWVMLVEGIERCDTKYLYPKEAGEILVQGMIEFEVTYRSEWPPYLPNALTSVMITARPARSAWTCVYCGTSNAGDAPCCSVCRAGAPRAAAPVTLSIPLES